MLKSGHLPKQSRDQHRSCPEDQRRRLLEIILKPTLTWNDISSSLNRSIFTPCIVTVLEELYACIIVARYCQAYVYYACCICWRSVVHGAYAFPRGRQCACCCLSYFSRRETARGLPFGRWNVRRSEIEAVNSS